MKKIVKIAFIAAFTAIVGYNIYTSQNVSRLSDLALSNIDALADGEIGPAPGGTSYGCGYGLSYGGIGIIRACESCVYQYFVSYASGYSNCHAH